MAGEPALDKVLTALKTVLDPVASLVEIDRADDDSYGKGELGANGAINILHLRTTFEMHEHGVQLHRAALDLDMAVAVDADATNGARLRVLEADIVEALWADRTLGGLAQDVILISSGGDEDVRADEGARPLSIEVLYLTPVGDHRTILGATGPVP